MNKVYCSVWNASTGTWVAAPETARRQSKGSARLACALLLGGALLSTHQAMAACGTARNCTGGDTHRTNTDGGISGGNWTFSGNGSDLHAWSSDPVTGGSFTITNNAKVWANANSSISGGTFNISNGAYFEVMSSNAVTNGVNINLGSGGYLDLNSYTGTFASLNGSGTVLGFSSGGSLPLLILDGGAGSLSTFNGNTVIGGANLQLNSGRLILNGIYGHQNTTVKSGATLTATTALKNVTVESGATLNGSASSYDQLNLSGTYSPGLNSVTMTDFWLNGGTLVVTARDGAAASDASFISVNYMLGITNSTVHVEAQRGAWNALRTYRILETHNVSSLTDGDFAGVTANFAYLTPTLTKHTTGTAAYWVLTLERNGPGGALFSEDAQTRNQYAVANSIDNLEPNHPIYNYVLTLPVGEPAAAFDSLSGEAHASFLAGLPNITSHAYRLPLANLRNSLNAGLNPAAVTAQVGGTQGSSGLPAFGDKPAWVELVGNWQNVDGDSNAGSLDQNSVGVFAGYDNDIGNGWYLGGALGYTQTDADVSSRDSEADIHSYSATLYGGKAFALDVQRQLNVLGGLSYTYHDIDSERKVRALGQKLTAGYDAHTTQVFGEVGYLIGKPDGRYVEPFAGLTVSHLEVGSFKEKGGSAALKGDSDDDTQVVSSLGVRGQLPYEFGNFGATLRGSLAWQHAFGDEHMDATMRFVDGGHDFNVRGVSLERDTAVLGLGTQLNVSPNAAISLDYEGRYASGLREHSASLKAQWNF
ncbi:autotransporter domain-containing protein [Pseudomonas sp. Z8(2022)]|uniref:autotransporter domain-containing protein n=1 Tax=Pseudomonas sp. Z8(2022) TaxID=2962597 RepID=UPI0021F45E20|nr:autotransporter domain-containing protein [Pseudomonas sp. Z8(2022)]UYP30448.1 autotransporter domain-containing protein [Pseudomonas sp. Z8(2022)]